MPIPSLVATGAFCRRASKATFEIGKSAANNLGVWALSLIATLILPCLPLAVEYLHTSKVQPENITLTAAVMAAGFIFTAEHPLTLCAHVLLFLAGLLLGGNTGASSPVSIERWSGTLLVAVGLVHAIERFIWHGVLARPFPEGLLFGKRRQP